MTVRGFPDTIESNGDEAMEFQQGRTRKARAAFRRAGQEGRRLFNPVDPLELKPFEVRFLADQRRPTRWVIDLSKSDDILIQPPKDSTVKNQEDRLSIPEEYVALFVEKGWHRQRPAVW
ncbi:MAG: hypothetical protein ACUVWO_14095 [Thermodesulfobacteriota bacterium]